MPSPKKPVRLVPETLISRLPRRRVLCSHHWFQFRKCIPLNCPTLRPFYFQSFIGCGFWIFGCVYYRSFRRPEFSLLVMLWTTGNVGCVCRKATSPSSRFNAVVAWFRLRNSRILQVRIESVFFFVSFFMWIFGECVSTVILWRQLYCRTRLFGQRCFRRWTLCPYLSDLRQSMVIAMASRFKHVRYAYGGANW